MDPTGGIDAQGWSLPLQFIVDQAEDNCVSMYTLPLLPEVEKSHCCSSFDTISSTDEWLTSSIWTTHEQADVAVSGTYLNIIIFRYSYYNYI